MKTASIKDKLRHSLSRLGHGESWRRLPLKLAVRYAVAERPRRFPRTVQIEATSRCNLRCPCCSHARETGSGRHMEEADFRRILDRLPRSTAPVILSGIGEPLMNPQFFAFVDILAERKTGCQFYTNGTLLSPRVQKAILARSNVFSVSISCDGAQPTTFENARVGADFGGWKRSVQGFVTQARKQRGRALRVGMNVVVSTQNLAEIGDILRLAAQLGFDNVSVMHPIPVDGVAAGLCPSPEALAAVNEQALLPLGNDLGLKVTCWFRRDGLPPSAFPRCLQPWEYVFIRANGDVAPCCALFGSDRGAVMGNILEREFAEIWHGPRFQEFRRTSAFGTNPLCRVCPYY